MSPPRASELLDCWFGKLDDAGLPDPAVSQRWFRGGPAFDQELRQRFGRDVEAALAGEREAWASTPSGRLALVLLLDQLTRNIQRGTAGAFAGDARALQHAVLALEGGEDQRLRPIERCFLYMPFEHAEDREQQVRAVLLFESLASGGEPLLLGGLDWARRHQRVIERFGRFPSRNLVLGRSSTPEELAFLAETPAGF